MCALGGVKYHVPITCPRCLRQKSKNWLADCVSLRASVGFIG